MALVIADRIKEFFTTTGTSTVTILGNLPGFKTFPAVMTNGDTCYYVMEDPVTQEWEAGIGTYNSSTIARTLVTASSNGGNTAISWTAGTKYVWIDTTARYFSDQYATAANMEALSSTTFVSPAVQQRHPGHPKAWAYVTVSGTTPTVQSNYNIPTCTYGGVAGAYTLSFTTAMSSANYCVQVSVGFLSGVGSLIAIVNGTSTGSCNVFFSNGVNSGTNPTSFHVSVYGDQ